ncbi:MAG: UDP-N-acetylmuramoyl-tripeptide--D-alanyl-D-alanine ligase [Phycisphaerales bacterium]|nr:UDP-N-acetylmuramoyl-tripeptide--D-alanyl-D-alanine ligase [Phycisphaerales bacterium]
MIKLTLGEVVQALNGRMLGEAPGCSISGVSTDTRQIGEGDLFFAIRGERFDGHDFVVDALDRGASFAVVESARYSSSAAVRANKSASAARLIFVDDTVTALGRLAAFHRPLVAAPVIGVVGSNGKTTTKCMIDHVLAGARRGRSSPKSFNNAIGVPLTLLSAGLSDEYLVVEIGTNAPGEIGALAAIAKPDAAVLTSIGEEHLEGLGSLAGVAAEECMVFEHIPSGGAAVVNIDAPEVQARLPNRGVKIVTYGARSDADLRISEASFAAPWLRFRINDRFDYRLRAPGLHNAWNATAAIAIGRRFGIEHADIAARLETFALPAMRMETVEVGGVIFVNDAYNANPTSVEAAITTLASFPTEGRRVVVLGEMRELGKHSQYLHRRVGSSLAQSGVNHALLVGMAASAYADGIQSSETGLTWELVADAAEAARRLIDLCRPGDVVLLKASRAVGLERVIELLSARMASPPTTSVA